MSNKEKELKLDNELVSLDANVLYLCDESVKSLKKAEENINKELKTLKSLKDRKAIDMYSGLLETISFYTNLEFDFDKTEKDLLGELEKVQRHLKLAQDFKVFYLENKEVALKSIKYFQDLAGLNGQG